LEDEGERARESRSIAKRSQNRIKMPLSPFNAHGLSLTPTRRVRARRKINEKYVKKLPKFCIFGIGFFPAVLFSSPFYILHHIPYTYIRCDCNLHLGNFRLIIVIFYSPPHTHSILHISKLNYPLKI